MNLTLIILPIMLIVYGAIIYLFVLLAKALRSWGVVNIDSEAAFGRP